MGKAFLILRSEAVGKVSVLFLKNSLIKSSLIKSMIATKQLVIRWVLAILVCMYCEHDLMKFRKN